MRNKVIGGLTAIILLLTIYISINSYFSVFTTEKWGVFKDSIDKAYKIINNQLRFEEIS